jgi:SnoaL-like domain
LPATEFQRKLTELMNANLLRFAETWISDWNNLDLETILSHYSEDVIFTSPRALARIPETMGTVCGLDQLRHYWAPLKQIRPDLRFSLDQVFETVNGCTLLYRDENGLAVAETMLFDSEGKVIRGIVSHAVSSARF